MATQVKYRVTLKDSAESSILTQEEMVKKWPVAYDIMERHDLDSFSKEIPIYGHIRIEKIIEELPECERCSAVALVEVCGKTSDLCNMRHLHREYDGYVLRGMGVGEDDYLEFTFCANCGQIQGEWPKRIHGRIVTRQTEGYPYGTEEES